MKVGAQMHTHLQRINGVDAYANLRGTARYPRPDRDPERYVPLPTVEHKAKFTISADAKIFTIGSCFARNVERALVNLGFNVLSSFIEGVPPDQNITNKYTPPSIRQDLELVLQREKSNKRVEDTFYRHSAGGYVNLAFGGSGAMMPLTLGDLAALSNRYYETFSKVRDADVIIITLGLVEVWFDRRANQYLNIAPTRGMVLEEPERFELCILSYSDILSELELIYGLINEHCKPGVNILTTVSPVPLHATFRGQDCLQANMYSKCVLRAAVEEFCARHPEIGYFPSFEMVMLTSPELAWIEKDYRHVRPELVERLMSQVLSSYVDRVFPPTKIELQDMLGQRSYSEMIERVERYFSSGGGVQFAAPHVAYYYGVALNSVGRYSDAVRAFDHVVDRLPQHELARRHRDAAAKRVN